MRQIILLFSSWIMHFITYHPNPLGNRLRYCYYKKKLKYLGENATIDFGVHIINPSYVSIGKNTHVDRFVTLAAGPLNPRGRKVILKSNSCYNYKPGEIHIGDDIHIAPYAYILGSGGILIGDRSGVAAGTKIYSLSNHYRNPEDPADLTMYAFTNRPGVDQLLLLGPVVMKEDSALGLNSILLPGSIIGENSWVGVQSCVAGEVPPNTVASGSPAKVIKSRESK